MKFILACVLILGLFCTLSKPRNLGPVDLVVILDEGKSCADYFKAIKWDLHEAHSMMISVVNGEFLPNWDRTRVAVICTGSAENPASVVVQFSDRKISIELSYVRYWCNIGTDYPDNIDLSFTKAEELLHGQDSRRNVPKVVLVLTDGHLVGNEVHLSNKPKPIIKDAKVFLFVLFNENHPSITHLGQTILIKSNEDYFREAIRKFSGITCESDNLSKEDCKAVPEDKSMKCQSKKKDDCECAEEYCNCDEMYLWNKACIAKPNDTIAKCQRDLFGNSKCEKFCDETYCNCEEMYPWEKACNAKPNDATAKCQRDLIGNSNCKKSCNETYCKCDDMYPWGLCSVTCGDGITVRTPLPASICEIEMDCHVKPCSKPHPLISGPLDLVIILDESKSFRKWHADKKKIIKGTYRKMMSLVVDNFEIGWEKVRVATYCTADSGNLTFSFLDNKTTDYIREQGCPSDKDDNPDNIHLVLNKAAQQLLGPASRANTIKAVLVFTDGYLNDDEKKFHKETEILQKDGKLFFFHLAEFGDNKLALDAMIKLTNSEKNVIFVNQSNLLNVSDNFRAVVCAPHLVSEENCKATPEDKEFKCQLRSELGGCSTKFCDEKYCHCDEMYPWQNCSVPCGDGIKRRDVLPKSACEIEMDCHVDPPCLTNITRISGPLDIVVILDESKSFYDWHVAKKKVLNGIYRKMMNWVVNNFEIGLDKTRIAVLCDSRTVFRFEESTKSDDEIRKQGCSLNGSIVDNMHESFNTAIDILNNEPGNRKTVEKAILIFTDGYLKSLVELYNYQKGAEFVRNGGNIFFFHLVEMNDPNLSKKSMVDLAKNETNVIFFNVLQPHNMFVPLYETFCGSHRFSKETCKAVPNNEKMKCQLKFTSMMGGCYSKDVAVRCDESYCECDEMYPWHPECPAICAGTKNRQVSVGSICPPVIGCFGPCPTVPFDRLNRVYK